MNVDDSNLDGENVVDDSVHLSPVKSDGRKDVGPAVGTSLDQQDKQAENVGTHDEDGSGYKNGSEKKVPSGGTAEDSPT